MVPFHDFKFPNCEEDPVEMIVKDYDDKVTEYRLKSYRYPPFHDLKEDCQDYDHKMDTEFKGVVFYVHGFGEYVGRFAHVAKQWSEMGYDFFAMDQRGHGKSEGKTVLIQNVNAISQDTLKFHTKVMNTHYNEQMKQGNQPPVFVIGYSFGCMQILNLLLRKSRRIPEMPEAIPVEYTGICFVNPFFGINEKAQREKVVPLLKVAQSWNKDAMTPEYKINID